MTDPRALIAQARALLDAATPGPWAWAQVAEKGYGTCIGAECYAEADEDAETPLAGNLSDREDNYTVLEPIAECGHQLAQSDSAFIVFARNHLAQLVELVEAGIRDTERLRLIIARAASDLHDWEEYREEYVWQNCPHEDAWLDEERTCRHCGAVVPADDATEITYGRPWFVGASAWYKAVAGGWRPPEWGFDDVLASRSFPQEETPR